MAAGGGGRSRGGSGAPASLRDLYGSPGRSGAGARDGAHADAGSPRTRAPPGVLRGLPGCGGAGGRARRSPQNSGGRAGGRAEARGCFAPAREGAAGPGAAALGRRACGCEQPAAARRTGRGAARLGSAWPAGPHTMALAEVVVCAVGRVVTLPAVEITAQATALLVLVMLSAAAEDNGWGSPLCSGARGPRAARTPAGWGRTKPWARPLEECERGSCSATFCPKDLN